jgi:sugar-specific transcriptional regulator TrmB
MVEFLQRLRQEKEQKQEIAPLVSELQPHHILVAGAGLEILRDVKQKLEKLELRLLDLEKKLEEKIPGRALTEEEFKKEVQTSEDIVNKIISEVRILAQTKQMIKTVEEKITEEKPTPVEFKRIENITSLLQKHGKLSSLQLAQLTNLSRTRCNEYFKQMENLGLVEPIIIGKEKYYRLRNNSN